MINTEKLCPSCMNDTAGEKICPICGANTLAQNASNALPVKQMLADRYIVGLEKSRNGQSITYIGWDAAEDTAVSINEYFPEGFAVRNPDKTVRIKKGGEYTFNEGLMEFLEINRKIKDSELPSLPDVIDIFEENGTVYAVSKNIASISLKEFLAKNGGTLKWEQTRPLFLPLIDTIKGMNDEGIIHGGISTETIMVGRDGKLRLSGYSVKKLRTEDSELKTEIFGGFAAIEQYADNDLAVGTYTDVYALCAVIFTVLIGTTPAEAPLRLQNDSMTIPAKFAEELPRHVLSALANGLQVMPQNRSKNIEKFKNELVYAEMSEAPAVVKTGTKSTKTKKKSGGTAKYVIISSACTALIFLAIAVVLIFTVFKNDIFGTGNESNDNDFDISAPSVPQIGTVDSDVSDAVMLFEVPNMLGKYYSEIENNKDYEKLEIVIKSTKEYSDKYKVGQICAQSIAAGTGVVNDTKVEITISLGPKQFKMPNVLSLEEEKAKMELLKQGFLYGNIEVLEKYDEDKQPGKVIEQEPKYGTQVSNDSGVKIYINSYKGNTESSNEEGTDADS